ncbi:uncharacterized protein LOC135575805 [Columba livia]|uniref:uncharacterized protein LOC135575805 n=1 Tax=Columba livia TaxID=8932 RepID=UPI0031BB0CEC
METAQQLQAEVRPGDSAPSPRWLGRVLAGSRPRPLAGWGHGASTAPGLVGGIQPGSELIPPPLQQPDEPRATVQSGGHEHAGCHFCSPDTRVLLGKLLQRCKKLEEQMESLAQKAGGKVDNYPKWRRQSLQQDEQIKCLQASIMQLQKDYEKFSSALANLQQDRQQEQNDIKALSQALERIKKQKADKEELLVLGIDEKADKDKVSRSQFEACVEQLNKVMEEVTGQEKFLHRFQQELQRQMDCKVRAP